jgi:hypothetical protein
MRLASLDIKIEGSSDFEKTKIWLEKTAANRWHDS